MSYITGFYKGRLGIGLTPTMGMGDGNLVFLGYKWRYSINR